MNQRWYVRVLCALWVSTHLTAWAQTGATVDAPTKLTLVTPSDSLGAQPNRSRRPDRDRPTVAQPAVARPDAAQPDAAGPDAARPVSLTFTASTDQRFFFFNDTRNGENRRMPTAVYGLRAGFLFPARHRRDCWRFQGGRSAAFKTGVGFYFVNQQLDRPGLLPNTAASITRRLRFVMAFYEPYLLRKGPVEVSMPIEFGYGHSRYERNDAPAKEQEVARGVFLPMGVGLSTAYQFPNIRWFRPFHWFGLTLLTGYRFVVKRDVPASQINYNGLYLSIGPSFFFENFTTDIKSWRKRRKKK